MIIYSYIFSPIILTFLAIAVGLCIGKIKIFNISLDLSAVLIVAVVIGFIVNMNINLMEGEQVIKLNSYLDNISSLGTSLFVPTVGLSAGYRLTSKTKGKCSSLFVGMFMVLGAFMVTHILKYANIQFSESTLLGVLCGALTTTPGLSAVCEKNNIVAEEAFLGYGSAYLFGVIFTVIMVQFLTRKNNIKASDIKVSERHKSKAIFNGILQLAIVILLGRLIGMVTIPHIKFSLGNSGGMLCAGIIMGYIINKFFSEHTILKEHQEIIRNIGLILFFVGNGIPAGMQLYQGFTVIALLLGILLTVVPILTGWLICRLILKKSNNDTAAIISGGMTSTPAIGVLYSKIDVAYDKYSFAYVGALIAIIVLCRL